MPKRSRLTQVAIAGVATVTIGLGAVPSAASPGPSAPPQVLRVGTFNGIPGQYQSIQAAVDAAHTGDWILVAPGDYHETGAPNAGVLITTPGIHVRGLQRNSVIVDGTQSGGTHCSSAPSAQNPGSSGRNGIEVLKADGVSVENLTVCNFLNTNSGSNGNAVWFNGGDGSGQIGLGSFRGGYLTASTTYFDPSAAASYGIFVSNARGPGVIENAYASNMSDSSFYVGACGDCNTVLRYVHAENSALGYSGSNAGGHLVIEGSEWDLNRAGIVPNSLANDDPPSPQDGACPGRATASCTVIRDNYVHDNNNPNTPALGLTAGAPVGTGIEISGGRNDTIEGNLVTGQGSWGILLHDYPDLSPPSVPTYCQGGLPNYPTPLGTACYFVGFGTTVKANFLFGNGTFENPSNGDLADATVRWQPSNCFVHNVDPATAQPSSDPLNIESPSVLGTCGGNGKGDLSKLFWQITCAALNLCPKGGTYPQPTGVRLLPIPHDQPSMLDPCAGVPNNPWCDRSGRRGEMS
jgi:Right handed beta helix region